MTDCNGTAPLHRDEHTRLCPGCMVRWTAFHDLATRQCPRCRCEAFFTMRSSDMGTFMQLDAAGLTIEDFTEVPS